MRKGPIRQDIRNSLLLPGRRSRRLTSLQAAFLPRLIRMAFLRLPTRARLFPGLLTLGLAMCRRPIRGL